MLGAFDRSGVAAESEVDDAHQESWHFIMRRCGSSSRSICVICLGVTQPPVSFIYHPVKLWNLHLEQAIVGHRFGNLACTLFLVWEHFSRGLYTYILYFQGLTWTWSMTDNFTTAANDGFWMILVQCVKMCESQSPCRVRLQEGLCRRGLLRRRGRLLSGWMPCWAACSYAATWQSRTGGRFHRVRLRWVREWHCRTVFMMQ